MLGRSLTLLAATALYSLPAAADPAKMCGGKYAEAATIVDHAHRQYETLYSGGNHWQRLDNVGPTLDAYRLFRGYPDIKLRANFRQPGWDNDWDEDPEYNFHWGSGIDPERIWQRMSWPVRQDAPLEPDAKQVFWAGFGWDIMTAGNREVPDWWRNAKPADAGSPGRKWLIIKARTEPALDWMQMVLAGSNTPWANNWLPFANVKTSTLSRYQSLATTAFDRYESGKGIEWLVAAAINAPDIDSVPGLAASLDKLAQDVAACSATPSEYAAYASSRLPMERNTPTLTNDPAAFDDMPIGIKSHAMLRTIHLAMAGAGQNPTEARRTAASLVSALPAKHASLGLLRLYLARNIDEIPVDLMPKSLRAYNLLSADNLAALGKRSPGAPMLINAAFARHVALGNTAKAVALLEDIKTANPDQSATIDRIWHGRQPETVRLALIVLAAPSISALVDFGRGPNVGYDGDYALNLNASYYNGHRNLPSQYSETDFVQRDFEVELRLPQRMDAYHTMRGYTIDWMERLKERAGYDSPAANEAPQLFVAGGRHNIPFESLIAGDEIVRLTDDKQLMVTVSNHIVAWAGSGDRNSADREMAANALAKVIALCKFNVCSGSQSRPTASQAFQILKRKFPDSQAARLTRWWYKTAPDYD